MKLTDYFIKKAKSSDYDYIYQVIDKNQIIVFDDSFAYWYEKPSYIQLAEFKKLVKNAFDCNRLIGSYPKYIVKGA